MGAGVTHKADSSTPPLDSSGTNKTSLKTESKGDGQHVSSHYKPKSQSYVQEKYTGGGPKCYISSGKLLKRNYLG